MQQNRPNFAFSMQKSKLARKKYNTTDVSGGNDKMSYVDIKVYISVAYL